MTADRALSDATAAFARRVETWDGEQLVGSLAAELGHHLAETSLDSLGARTLRLAVARAAQRNREHESAARAARDTIRLLSAYESSHQSIENDVVLGRGLDEPTREILRRLTRGPITASELAGGRDNGKYSRRLATLESEGVIESAAAPDGRVRPKTLTARGRVLAQRLEATSDVISADEHSSRMRRAVASCVKTTLRTLEAIRVNSTSTPMRRSEVRASLDPDLRAFGILESFERWAEGLGLVDIDSDGAFWDVQDAAHSKRWERLFHDLSDPATCQRVFHADATTYVVIVTVPARSDEWRRVAGPLGRRVSVQTASTFGLSDDVQRQHPNGRVVVDDTTLASSLKVEGFVGPMLTIEQAANAQWELSPIPELAGAAA